MLPLRLAVSTECFGTPLKRSVIIAAQAGATGVQFDARNELRPSEFSASGRRDLLRQLGDMSLKVSALTFPTRGSYYDQENLEARLAGTRAAMEFAMQLKAGLFVLRLGRIPSEEQAGVRKILHDVVTDLARFGNRLGVTLAVTPAHDDPEHLRDFLAEIDSGPIGVNFDAAGILMSGHDPATALRTLRQQIVHVRVRDAVRDMDGSGQEVPLGRGEVEWETMLAILDEVDYHNWLTVDRTQGEDRAGDVTRALAWLRQTMMG